MPPSAVSKQAGLGAHRAGEGALLVAEQLALEQRLGQRRAVEAQERRRRARRAAVDRLGQHLLADAGLAEDQHGERAAGDALGQRVERAHRRGPPPPG